MTMPFPIFGANVKRIALKTLWGSLPLLFVGVPSLKAQITPCGLTTIADTMPLLYPPIARQAHVTGQVILLANFNLDGTVASTKTINGSKMLEVPAIGYVMHWRADPYTGPRECPIVVEFRMIGASVACDSHADTSGNKSAVWRFDLQHASISADTPCLNTMYTTKSVK